jgi:ribonucleoside-diphosphate reductase alpha chain
MTTSVGELKEKAQEYLVDALDGLNGLNPLTVKEFKAKIDNIVENKPDLSDIQLLSLLVLKANENLNVENIEPGWVNVSARLLLQKLYLQASSNRNTPVGHLYSGSSFTNLLVALVEEGIYNPDMLYSYTANEVYELGELLQEHGGKDREFTFIGLKLLAERYLATDFERNVMELPQERFMMIAMNLQINEPRETRMEKVKESYWALRNRFMTTATPTLSNSGKSYGQFASCFIDIMGDSLDGIYLNNWDVARLSKGGGGVGVYIGKVRALGSDIKNFKGISSGQLPWSRQLDNTASSVDQLGQRQGSITLYNDVWHKGIVKFLDSKLNNGEEREKLHTVSLGLCIPDIYMRKLAKKEKWYLFDPHEISKVMGFRLEDFFDEEKLKGGQSPDKEKHAFSYHYELCVQEPTLDKVEINPIALHTKISKVRKESGYPYMFYRDTANRMNPNKHVKGSMIYCTNLCTEIFQNMSETHIVKEYTEYRGDEIIIHTERKAGDFVVCTLSSINLAEVIPQGDDLLERLLRIQVRMLDNTIDLNGPRLDVLQAEETTNRYRAIGVGTFGWHHLLALEGIQWETEEAVERCDEVYERIAFYTIKASMELAYEKGAYPLFKGSEWETGKYFERREYSTASSKARLDWDWLKEKVQEHGIRNGYLMAVAPNASTAKIGGSTDGIDPVFMAVYADEKKRSKDITVAPDLSFRTLRYYKSAYAIDQNWSILQNARRAKHIDQGISFNLYVPEDVKASTLIKYDLKAWNIGIKSTYYTRSLDVEVKECESCAG